MAHSPDRHRTRVDVCKREVPKRWDIQVLRCFAVSSVILFHLGLFENGFLGVDIFLTISGFVVMSSLKRREGAGAFDFYRRRFERLFPPLLVMLVSASVISVLVQPLGDQQIRALERVALSLMSLANISFWLEGSNYFGADFKSELVLHTWSLSLEEQFYLTLPMMIGAISFISSLGKSQRMKRAAVFLGLATVLAVSLGLYVSSVNNPEFQFFMLPSRAWQFLFGVIAAEIVKKSKMPNLRPLVCAVVLLIVAVGPEFLGLLRTRLLLALVLGCYLGILTPAVGLNAYSRFFQPLVAIGDRSYSLYLVHWPLVVLLPIFTLSCSRIV